MKYRWLPLIILFLLVVFAGSASAEEADPFSDPNFAAPSIWRVQGKGKDLHLMGSVHVGHEDGWQFSKPVRERFEGADLVIVELDIRSSEAKRAIQGAMESHSRLEEPQSLKTVLPADVYAQLQSKFKSEQLFPGMFEQGKPWLAANVLAAKKISELGYSTKKGVERQLLQDTELTQQVVALEEPESHVLVFEKLSPDAQVLMLRDTLYRLDEMGPYLDKLVESWRRGDDQTLEKTAFAELNEHPELGPFYDTFFFERNAKMAEKLGKYADGDRGGFALIGAGHLVGEKGVIAQLRERGYQVERIPSS